MEDVEGVAFAGAEGDFPAWGICGGGRGGFGPVARCGLEEKGWEVGEVGGFEGVVGVGS